MSRREALCFSGKPGEVESLREFCTPGPKSAADGMMGGEEGRIARGEFSWGIG